MNDPSGPPTSPAGTPSGASGTSPTGHGAGWFPDPLGRYDHRWYNGTTWTADVSVDGQRYVDPMPLTPTPATGWSGGAGWSGGSPYGSAPSPGAPHGWTPAPGWQPAPRRPTRTMAVLAMIFGIAGLATSWMPLFFVFGGAAAIAAFVLGLVARSRIRDGRATGKGMATSGVVLGPLALALCVVGVILTGNLVREVTRFAEPGPNDVEITSCVADGLAVRAAGTITNLDDAERDYTIELEVFDGREFVARADVIVDDVSPGDTVAWERTVLTQGRTPAEPECEIFAVNGPYPFGLDPNP